jgi:hypothetical protein
MGSRSSRDRLQNKETHSRRSRTSSSNKKVDQESFNQLHMDLHYNAMDQILNHHLILMHLNITDTDQEKAVMNIHKNALNIAIRHHINATHSNSPLYEQGQQMTYTM